MIRLGMHDLTACLYPKDPEFPPKANGLEKAVDKAYNDLMDALRQVSRIAVRLGYIDKEVKYDKK